MRWRFLIQVVLGVALVVGIVALGGAVYQAGYVAGVATEGGAVVAPPGAYGYGWGWHGGFGLFGLVGFLLFLFLLFGLFRAIAWGGRGWRGGHGAYGPRGPWGSEYGTGHGHPGHERGQAAGRDWFDEWHRRAHEFEADAGPGRGGEEASGRDTTAR